MDGSKGKLNTAENLDESPESPTVGIVEQAPPKLPPALTEALSGYRVIRKISEHPGSIVFKAEDRDASKLVIIKVVDGDPERATDQLVIRSHEIDRIKHLHHPCVAAVLEIGSTSDGQSYFISEAIRGQSMMEFARTHHLSVDDRIKLFLKICAAVERLHQRCIVHRDLRPSNVLIGGRGEPRLTGMGVAAVTDFDLGFPQGQVSPREARIFYTYRSPEQVRGVSREVDTRSDVYVLGVLLYELLTGQAPYDIEVNGNSEVFRVIAELPPRGMELEAAKWPSGVKAVIQKAMEKAPERRFQSVHAMALELQLAIGKAPAGIRSASRSGGPVRRFVAGVAMLMLASGTFAAGTYFAPRVREALPPSLQAQLPPFEVPNQPAPPPPPKPVDVSAELKQRVAELEAAQVAAAEQRESAIRKHGAERKRRLAVEKENNRLAATFGKLQDEIRNLSDQIATADSRVQRAADITGFLMGMFRPKDPGELSLRSPSAIDLLESAEQAAVKEFQGDRATLATVLNYIGVAYGGLGAYGKASQILEQVLDLRHETLGEDHDETISTMNDLTALLYNQGKLAEGRDISRRLVTLSSKAFGGEDERTLTATNNLALIEYGLGHIDEAETLFRKAMRGRKKAFGETDDRTATTTYQLAIVLFERGKLAKAEPYFRKAIKAFDQSLPPHHALPATARSYLGGILVSLGRFNEAEPLLLESYRRLVASLGPDHPTSRTTIDRIVSMYTLWNRPADAEKWRAQIGRVRVNGPGA